MNKALRPKDWVLIQFGYNDNGKLDRRVLPGSGDETVSIFNNKTKQQEEVHTYGWYMRKMIRDVLKKKGNPVIMSPVVTNKWTKFNGSNSHSLGGDHNNNNNNNNRKYNSNILRYEELFTKEAMKAAKDLGVTFLDHYEILFAELDKKTPADVKKLFATIHHVNQEGAKLESSLIVAGLKCLRVVELTSRLSEKGKPVAAQCGRSFAAHPKNIYR